jgi:hypothetical protein
VTLLREVLTRVVRTAAPEVNRRRYPRYQLDRSVVVDIGGQSLTVRLGNISEGGALFELGTLSMERTVRMSIPGLADGLRAKVLANENGRCHVSFEEDDADQQQFARRFAEAVKGLQPLGEAA